MPLFDTLQVVYDYTRDTRHAYAANDQGLLFRLADVFSRTWDLGFTAFGGPPVHFQILYGRFVQGRGRKTPWVDEQTYHELFALTQALPGPASTKMLFCMALIRAGLIPAIFAFMLWSLPCAIGMFALSLGVQHMSEILPGAVYALLSGLNASTVGIIALAAVQLAEKSIVDHLSRILVIFGACAGLCYNALWYFPVLIAIGGVVAAAWDIVLRQKLAHTLRRWRNHRNPRDNPESSAEPVTMQSHGMDVSIASSQQLDSRQGLQRRTAATSEAALSNSENEDGASRAGASPLTVADSTTDTKTHGITILEGCVIIFCFFASFAAIMAARAATDNPPRTLEVFTNMYLAGTIIFGGGPVVIPLLRAYVVEPGWVTTRDFLIGLAIIQAMPGPNFNFAVYLGALAVASTGTSSFVGAVLGFIGIFTPGLMLSIGVQGFWSKLRTKPIIIALLRGINATAVGLVFTAVYRLWQIGYLSADHSQGESLAGEPWWVVVAVITYAESAWFHVPPAPAIVLGALLGLLWYAAVGSH